MHSILGFYYAVLAFSTTVFASHPALPRKLEIRDLRLNNTLMSMPSMTSSSYSSSSGNSTSDSTSDSTSSTYPSRSSTTSIEITTSSQPSCLGSVTYYATSPPTVYQTVTIPFTVTVTAANVSLTTPPIYTPPPPCFQSVMSAGTTTHCEKNCPAFGTATLTGTATPTGSAYTSTVLVTKKTPVPTVVSDTSPPPNYNAPSTPAPATTPAPNPGQGSPVPVAQASSPVPVAETSNPVPAGNSPPPETSESQGNGGPQVTTGVGGNSPAPAGGKGSQTTAAPIGSVVDSPAANQATSATVNGVPVIVLPSSSGVVIGGQIVSVPPSGYQSVVVANGNTFTLGQSAIAGPGTTIALAVAQASGGPTPVTADGLTFQVGVTQAIISGKTYAIGAGAPKTTLTIGGETVVVGPSGVAVPGTTIPPAKATTGPSMSVVTADGVTITYDGTEAIVGSSTYRIGQGASQTAIITINGQTVSIGPSGVGLRSTTIHPPSATATLPTGGTASVMVKRLVSSSVLITAAGLLGCLLV